MTVQPTQPTGSDPAPAARFAPPVLRGDRLVPRPNEGVWPGLATPPAAKLKGRIALRCEERLFRRGASRGEREDDDGRQSGREDDEGRQGPPAPGDGSVELVLCHGVLRECSHSRVFAKAVWRYELEPVAEGTRITETFDHGVSRFTKGIELMKFPRVNAKSIRDTLRRPQEIFGAPQDLS